MPYETTGAPCPDSGNPFSPEQLLPWRYELPWCTHHARGSAVQTTFTLWYFIPVATTTTMKKWQGEGDLEKINSGDNERNRAQGPDCQLTHHYISLDVSRGTARQLWQVEQVKQSQFCSDTKTLSRNITVLFASRGHSDTLSISASGQFYRWKGGEVLADLEAPFLIWIHHVLELNNKARFWLSPCVPKQLWKPVNQLLINQ